VSGNPGGRRKKAPRIDGLTNVATGLGLSRDKRMHADWSTLAVSDIEAREMWRSDGIAARIIELLPRTMFREGYEVKLEDKEQAEQLVMQADELGANAKFIRAKEYERAYGLSAIIPFMNDGAFDLAEPLREDRILSVEKLSRVIEPRELQPWRYDDDGEVEVWLFQPLGWRGAGNPQMLIHASRLIVFPGIRVTHEPLPGVREGCGDSVLTRVRSRLRDLVQGSASAAALLGQSAQAIVKMKDLARAMAEDGDGLIKARLELLDFMRSVLKMMPIDAEDDFQWQTTPMTGFAETIDRLMQMLSADTGIPVTILMGRSPAGLNATGDADTRSFYDLASEEQRFTTPQVERLFQLLMLAKDGPTGGAEPDHWSIEWQSLWQPDDKEIAEARRVQAETDKTYIEMQVLSPEEVAASRFGGDVYSFETVVDFDARARQEPAADPPAKTEQQIEEEQAAADAQAAQLAALNGGGEEEETEEFGGEEGETDDPGSEDEEPVEE
jgi:hypothetical protein